jgi:hypothetical protein
VHGHDISLTVTVTGVEDVPGAESVVRVTLTHGKHNVQETVRDNPHVVSAVIPKLAKELATVLDRNQSRVKKIFG